MLYGKIYLTLPSNIPLSSSYNTLSWQVSEVLVQLPPQAMLRRLPRREVMESVDPAEQARRVHPLGARARGLLDKSP